MESPSCPVCLGHLSNPFVTNCGHVYCARCLFTVVVQSTPHCCPSCRSLLKLCTPHDSDVNESHLKLSISGVTFLVGPSSRIPSLFGLSDHHRYHVKLIHKGKIIQQGSDEMQELARKKATVLMILSTPLARRKGELLEAVLRRLHLFFLLVLALLNKLIAPIVPPIKLLILSLAPGFDPKKLRKQEDRPRPRQ